MLLSNEAMVSEFRSSAMTQEAFCKLHDISIEKLRYYLYKKKSLSKTTKKINKNPFDKKTQPSFVCLKKNTSISNDVVLSGLKTQCTIICGSFTIDEIYELTGLNRR
jgi:hypothetical protein